MSSLKKVVLACNFPRDERFGSSRVPLRTAAELERAGVEVVRVFSEDLSPIGGGARVEQLTAPARMAAKLAQVAADADVVDIAGFDAWVYAHGARWLRPRQALVTRSNGLWRNAVAFAGQAQRTATRSWLSDAYQRLVPFQWERSSIAAADVAVFMSSPDADEVVRRGWQTADGVAVVNPGVEDRFASPVPLDSRKDVAFVGTFFERKGCDVVGVALSQVMRERQGVGLTLLGPGMPADAALAKFDEGVRGRVTIVDLLPAEELARRLGHFAVLVFPTRYEGFGLVVLEAMRAGLAVVTTPTGAGVDVVRDGQNGLLVPADDPVATARAVGRLLDEPGLRLRLARAAVEEARTRTWARTAADLLAAYDRAHARAARRG